jgi:hypothetical protein
MSQIMHMTVIEALPCESDLGTAGEQGNAAAHVLILGCRATRATKETRGSRQHGDLRRIREHGRGAADRSRWAGRFKGAGPWGSGGRGDTLGVLGLEAWGSPPFPLSRSSRHLSRNGCSIGRGRDGRPATLASPETPPASVRLGCGPGGAWVSPASGRHPAVSSGSEFPSSSPVSPLSPVSGPSRHFKVKGLRTRMRCSWRRR